MSICVLQTMLGKDKHLTVSKLQTSCLYHNFFKNYKLLDMIPPPPKKKKKKNGEYG